MADPKSIHEFTSGEGALGSLFLMDSPDQQASSGYTTEKLAMTDLGDFLNNEMEYTQDLDTEDKKISGALNELHGVDGFDVYDETTTSANKYEQGDICIHNNTLQVCTSANGAYGAWDSSKWSPTSLKALLAPLTKEKMVVVYATNGARLWIKRLGNTVQVEMNESSKKSFYATWANLFTDTTYQTRAYLDSDFIGTANTLHVPIGLVNGHQIVLKIEKVNGAIQMICDTADEIYPQGCGIYTLA